VPGSRDESPGPAPQPRGWGRAVGASGVEMDGARQARLPDRLCSATRTPAPHAAFSAILVQTHLERVRSSVEQRLARDHARRLRELHHLSFEQQPVAPLVHFVPPDPHQVGAFLHRAVGDGFPVSRPRQLTSRSLPRPVRLRPSFAPLTPRRVPAASSCFSRSPRSTSRASYAFRFVRRSTDEGRTLDRAPGRAGREPATLATGRSSRRGSDTPSGKA